MKLMIAALAAGSVVFASPEAGAQVATAQPQVREYDFFMRQPRSVRPKDMYVLRYARDGALCATFVSAMNDPRPLAEDEPDYGSYNRAANDIFLGSRFTIAWTFLDTTSLRHAVIDIDRDGVDDHVFLETGSLHSHDFDKLYAMPVRFSDDKTPLAVYADLMRTGSPVEQFKDESVGKIVLDERTIDIGGAEPLPDRSDWMLGQFKNVAIIGGRAFVITGGNWQPVVGRNWFPVRLIEVRGHHDHRLMCELLPQYREKSIRLVAER